MREHAHAFGPDGRLIGIVTEPAIDLRREGAPVLLLANVGMHHRVGPFRLFVDLARGLAKLGFTTMRFDLSGLGDSQRADGSASDSEDAHWNEDLKSAMALLEKKHGAKSFVVLGLCSGVDPAHAIALSDARVKGAVFVDGHAFATPMHKVHRYVVRAASRRTWELFAKRRLPQLFGVEKERIPTDGFARPPMPQAQFASELEMLVERKIPLLFAFTGEQNWAFSHPSQFHDMVAPVETRGKVEVVIYPRADHTFSMPNDRRDFVDAMARWFSEHFPLAEPVSTMQPMQPATITMPPPSSVAEPAPHSGVRAVGDEDAEDVPASRPHIRLVS